MRMNLRSLIPEYMSLNGAVYRLARRLLVWWTGRWKFDILHVYADHKKHVRFIQIGSNNGIHGDPICTYIKQGQWKGILVEPVPYLFEQLKFNYSGFHDKLFFENTAIADTNGILPFYRLKKSDLPGLPVWYDQLGSFKKEVVMKHRDKVPFFDDLFLEDTVNAITFKDLLRKYDVHKVDLLHIDTEGYDYEIIKLIPLSEIDIDLIYFEHMHLADSDYKKAVRLLQGNGFIVRKKSGSDTIAVKNSVLMDIASVSQ